MSRRASSLVLSIVLMLVMALVATGAAQAAPSKAKAKDKAYHARNVKYWTPARMANAVPRDFVKTKGGFKLAAKGGTKPSKRPSGGGGSTDSGGSSTPTVTGASWTDGGPALQATGKVFFTMGGTNYVCSGAAVYDRGLAKSLVLTAGHCAYDETTGNPASKWMFVPAYDSAPTTSCGTTAYGCFSAKPEDLYADANYRNAGGFNAQAIKHDWAFAVVGPNGSGTQLDDVVAEFTIGFDAVSEARYSFGYPAAGRYYGNDLIFCSGAVITDSAFGTWGLRCDMTGGASGGPWMKDFSSATKSGVLNSVNSYKYIGGKKRYYMFGPKFNTRTEALYESIVP